LRNAVRLTGNNGEKPAEERRAVLFASRVTGHLFFLKDRVFTGNRTGLYGIMESTDQMYVAGIYLNARIGSID